MTSKMDPVPSRADPVVVNNIIDQLKSKGIFDQFRRDCLADVDTKPAYQNLRQRVEGYVSNYLGQHKWEPGMNKNQLRDSLRRQINQSEMLATGVERVIEQVVEPKIQHIFRPKIEQLVRGILHPESVAGPSNNNDALNAANNAHSTGQDIVAPPPEAPPPEAPSVEAPKPPPPPDEEDGIGEEDMDISTPSPTSSPDIRLVSPVEFEDEAESPPPIPGVDVEDAVDFGISVRTNVAKEIETSSPLPPLSKVHSPDSGKKTPPEIRIATSPEQASAKMAAFASILEQQKSGGATLVRQTEQMKIGDAMTAIKSKDETALRTPKISTGGKDMARMKANEDEDDSLIIAEEAASPAVKSSKRKPDSAGESDADSDALSDISDITVSSVHTSDLSSFDEEISSSSSDSSDSESQSSESSFDDKLSAEESKKSGKRLKSPSDAVAVSYRIVKLAQRGHGWFMDKYIYVRNKENAGKIFLRCQHKYLCKAVAYIDKATDKGYVKEGDHVHPPPDIRKITFGSDAKSKKSAASKNQSESGKSRKKKESPPKDRKVGPIRLIIKAPSPPETKEEELPSNKDAGITKKELAEEERLPVKEDVKVYLPTTPVRAADTAPSDESSPMDEVSPVERPAPAGRVLTEEEKKKEAERWAAYWEYSMAPSRRLSTKALALSRYHSDSEDEDSRDERRKKAALDKEERLRRRQEVRESGVPTTRERTPSRRPSAVTREQRRAVKLETTTTTESSKGEEEDEEAASTSSRKRRRLIPDSPVKVTKAQLKEQKIQEKKREMRRQRSLNKRYYSDEFSSPVQEKKKLKESLRSSSPGSAQELASQAAAPLKRPPPATPVKPVVLSFHLKWRERRKPQVESHFLLCNCLSGEQQMKMSARQQKQRSKIAGKQKARFSFQAKILEKGEGKKHAHPKGGRGHRKGGGVEEGGGGKESDVSRSSTPVQDEIPPEMLDKVVVIKEEPAAATKRGRGRPRKVTGDLDDKRGERSRSSTPVQDEMGLMLQDDESKDDPHKRKRGRPRKNVEEQPDVHQEGSRSSTPVQDVASSSAVDMASSAEGQRKRGRPRKATYEEEEKVEISSRSSTPVQDEIVMEEMEISQEEMFGKEGVIIQDDTALVEEMVVDVNPVEHMAVSEMASYPVEEVIETDERVDVRVSETMPGQDVVVQETTEAKDEVASSETIVKDTVDSHGSCQDAGDEIKPEDPVKNEPEMDNVRDELMKDNETLVEETITVDATKDEEKRDDLMKRESGQFETTTDELTSDETRQDITIPDDELLKDETEPPNDESTKDVPIKGVSVSDDKMTVDETTEETSSPEESTKVESLEDGMSPDAESNDKAELEEEEGESKPEKITTGNSQKNEQVTEETLTCAAVETEKTITDDSVEAAESPIVAQEEKKADQVAIVIPALEKSQQSTGDDIDTPTSNLERVTDSVQPREIESMDVSPVPPADITPAVDRTAGQEMDVNKTGLQTDTDDQEQMASDKQETKDTEQREEVEKMEVTSLTAGNEECPKELSQEDKVRSSESIQEDIPKVGTSPTPQDIPATVVTPPAEYASASVDIPATVGTSPADDIPANDVTPPAHTIPEVNTTTPVDDIPANDVTPPAHIIPEVNTTTPVDDIPANDVTPPAHSIPDATSPAAEMSANEVSPPAHSIHDNTSPACDIPSSDATPSAHSVLATDVTSRADDTPATVVTPPAHPIPAADVITPAGDVPATEGDVPATEGDIPATEGDIPATEGDTPVTELTPRADDITTASVTSKVDKIPSADVAPPADDVAPPADDVAPPADDVATPADDVATPADDVAKESAVDEEKDNNKLAKKSKDEGDGEFPLVVGHSPTVCDNDQDDDDDDGEELKDPDVKEKDNDDESLKKDAMEDSDNGLSVPALGSSPTIGMDVNEEEETTEEKEEDKETVVKTTEESKKKEICPTEDDLLVPALGLSPTQEGQVKGGKGDKSDQDASDIEDNPPTPTQDEPSSMDEISGADCIEGGGDSDKPVIPIFTVSSPSKSPLGSLFPLSRTPSAGDGLVQGSSGAVQSQTPSESSGADTNVDSEESAPSSSRESRRRTKRTVSSPFDSDFEYSHPKRLRTETPPPPVLQPELPVERPKAEVTPSRTTRASKQRHISPPDKSSPTPPSETGVRTRHRSSQSSESQQSVRTPSPVHAEPRMTRGRQQSVRTPSPVPAERVTTRGRRSSTRQSEDKQSHRYSDMVYYDTSTAANRRSQRQQSAEASPVGSRMSSRRSTEVAEKPPARGKRKR